MKQNYLTMKNYLDKNGYGFKLEDVEEIIPIKINGKLSLWEYDYKN